MQGSRKTNIPMIPIDMESKNYEKKLWILINSSIGRKTKIGTDIPNYFKENNTIFDNYKDIVEGFNSFFTNVGLKL